MNSEDFVMHVMDYGHVAVVTELKCRTADVMLDAVLNLCFYLSVELLQISTILVMFEFILRILCFLLKIPCFLRKACTCISMDV